MNSVHADEAARPRRRSAVYAIAATIAVIAALVLIVAPALTTALVAPGLNQVLDEPLRGTALAQIYFMPGLAALVLAIVLYMLHYSVADLRVRLLLVNFAAVAFVLLAVLRLDPIEITTEESKLAHFTGAVLLIAALCALCNALAARSTKLILLWMAVSSVFAFAAFDEILEIHEKIGASLKKTFGSSTDAVDQSAGLEFQDLVTLLYSVAGVIAVTAVYLLLKKRMKQQMYVIYVCLAAIFIYFVSTMLDTFDFLLARMSTTVDLIYLSSVLEEILEFVAASLFFVAFASAFLETRGWRRLDRGPGQASPLLALPRVALLVARGIAYAATAVFAAAAIAIPLRYPARTGLVTENANSVVKMFANSSANNLLHPDGMAYANGHLFVANDVPPSVMTITAGKFRLVATADELGRPETLEVARDGTIYVTDDAERLLVRIRQGLGPEAILGPRQLKEPKGLAFDSKGALYVVDYGTSSILVLRSDKAETYAAVPGHKPEEIAFDRSGNLYFTEESPARVMKISPDGALSTFADKSSGILAVEDIAIRGGDIFLADSGRGAIFKFALNGEGAVMVAFDKRTGAEIEAIAAGEDGILYAGFRKPERKLLGMRRVDFILCIREAARVNASC